MRYTKPTVMLIAPAATAVKGLDKDDSPTDNEPNQIHMTTSAYQADE